MAFVRDFKLDLPSAIQDIENDDLSTLRKKQTGYDRPAFSTWNVSLLLALLQLIACAMQIGGGN